MYTITVSSLLNFLSFKNTGGRNVAVFKQTNQSSVLYNELHAHAPSLATDGNVNQDATLGGCAHTDDGDFDPWWTVDLGRVYLIGRIVIYGRTDCCGKYIFTMLNIFFVFAVSSCFSFELIITLFFA